MMIVSHSEDFFHTTSRRIEFKGLIQEEGNRVLTWHATTNRNAWSKLASEVSATSHASSQFFPQVSDVFLEVHQFVDDLRKTFLFVDHFLQFTSHASQVINVSQHRATIRVVDHDIFRQPAEVFDLSEQFMRVILQESVFIGKSQLRCQ